MQNRSLLTGSIRQTGFTLLEVLVALAIFAISAGAIITQVSQATRQTIALEERSLALWVAENQLNKQLITGSWPRQGESRVEVTLAQREWIVIKTVENTNNPGLRRIDIDVSLKDHSQILASLRGYMGKR